MEVVYFAPADAQIVYSFAGRSNGAAGAAGTGSLAHTSDRSGQNPGRCCAGASHSLYLCLLQGQQELQHLLHLVLHSAACCCGVNDQVVLQRAAAVGRPLVAVSVPAAQQQQQTCRGELESEHTSVPTSSSSSSSGTYPWRSCCRSSHVCGLCACATCCCAALVSSCCLQAAASLAMHSTTATTAPCCVTAAAAHEQAAVTQCV
jgi:hypothetical protein